MSSQEIPATARRKLVEIAIKHFHLETIETRHSDRLDFHDVAVWSIEAALEAAYLAGCADCEGGAK